MRDSRAIGHETRGKIRVPTILSFVVDRANLVTLLGLSIGLLAIYFGLIGNFPAAIICMLWAVLMDWFDGSIARRMLSRSESHKIFGARMDSLVDMVVSATGPGILLLSVSEFNLWFLPGALAIIMAGVLRLAYFDSFGLDEKGTHAGITIDNSPLAISAVFLLYQFLDRSMFAVILYAVILILAYLHVAPFRMKKIGGRWCYAVTTYVVILSAVHAYFLLQGMQIIW
jgi:CDP-diacylglycerol--serine O-phosphatidyltransferase